MDPAIAALVVELIEKMGLIKRDMVQKKELEKYEARFARVEQKLSTLADRVSEDDVDLAKRLRTAWQMPARSLAFRNADHQKELRRQPHVVLLGDSIFDNNAYTNGEPDVVSQLRDVASPQWKATLLAVDGSRTQSVAAQFKRIPEDATHLVLSVGGNDALSNSSLLNAPVRSSGEALLLFAERVDVFEQSYRTVLKTLSARQLPMTVCTIYNGALPSGQARIARVALMMFNDVIVRAAAEYRAAVIELRAICVEESDYSNPIEPSGSGGRKIAQAIAQAVSLQLAAG
jgi:hypothetical protein